MELSSSTISQYLTAVVSDSCGSTAQGEMQLQWKANEKGLRKQQVQEISSPFLSYVSILPLCLKFHNAPGCNKRRAGPFQDSCREGMPIELE